MKQCWSGIEDLLHEALELPPDRRDRYLARVCGEDAELRRELESLIRADEEARDFLARPFLLNAVKRPDTAVERSSLGRGRILSRLVRQVGGAELGGCCTDEPGRLEPRSKVADRYRVLRFLGRGGMGEIYHALDLKLDESVALKFLPESMSRDVKMRSRFLREVRMARRVSHPNVCRVHDVGEAEGHLFLSMEFIDGEDLAFLLKRVGRPSREEALEILRQVCRGLEAVHGEGLLHRDLKPANVMVDVHGRVRITDFGIAGVAGSTVDREALLGTPAYMAPEQHVVGGEVDVRTDLYALGLLMYEVLTGQRTFRGASREEYSHLHHGMPPTPPSSLGVDLEPAVEQVILRCLDKRPGERPASVWDVAKVLEPAPALTSDSQGFRPLHQLPPPPADFTGREAELRELTEAVEHGGVMISGLQGMGGIGKTALALKLAEALAPRYPDAQIYLDLKGVSPEPLTPAQAMAHVIRAFRPQAPIPDNDSGIAAAYRTVLYGQRALLLMDNAAGVEQVEPLVPPRGCVLFVTSRRSFALPGLFAKRLDCLPPEDAAALMRRIVPRIGDYAETIAGLCGYLPIALRLASGALVERCDLTPGEYARRLAEGQGRLEFVEASLTLSYQLLDEELQRLWLALVVFPGSFDRAAATAVWDLDAFEAEGHLSELVRDGLVEWAHGRYRLHDLARAFAEDRLSAVGHFAFQWRHSEYYLGIVREAEELYMQGGERARRGLRLFDFEWINICAGQVWSTLHARDDRSIAKLCSDYPRVGSNCLWIRLPVPTRISWQESALEAARSLDDRQAQGHHLARLGCALGNSGRPHQAIEVCELAFEIAIACRDRHEESIALGYMGLALWAIGDLLRAKACYEQALDISRETADRQSEVRILGQLGAVIWLLGEWRSAIDLLDQTLHIAHEIGYREGEYQSMCNLGWAYQALGDFQRALELFEGAVLASRECGARRNEGRALNSLAWTYVSLGKAHRAIELAIEARSIARGMGDPRLECSASGSLGRAYLAEGESQRGIESMKQGLALARETNDWYYEGLFSWHLGLHYREAGDLERAIALMQVRVDYERMVGNTEAESHAAKVEDLRARLQAEGGTAASKPSGTVTA